MVHALLGKKTLTLQSSVKTKLIYKVQVKLRFVFNVFLLDSTIPEETLINESSSPCFITKTPSGCKQ